MLCHSAQTSVCPKAPPGQTVIIINFNQHIPLHAIALNAMSTGVAMPRPAVLHFYGFRSVSSVAAAVKNCGSASKCGAPLYLPLRAALVFMPLSTDTPPRGEAPSRHPARNIRARDGSRDIDVRISDIKTGDGQSSRGTHPNPVSQSSNFLN
jgi:hypothetical protein